MIEKEIAQALEPVVDLIVALQKRVDGFVVPVSVEKGEPGEPGKDADPVAVAVVLKADPAFVAMLKGEPGPAGKDAEPVEVCIDDVVSALKADAPFVESLKGADGLHGKDGAQGPQGDAGPQGLPGEAGAGIDAPVWHDFKVYREGAIVQHHFGQHFRALNDTATEPGQSDDWQRIGTAGLRWRGLKPDPETLLPGDFFIDGGSCFLQGDTKASMMVQRGAKGDRGDKGDTGPRGERGHAGRDGRSFVGGLLAGDVLTLSADDGSTVDVTCVDIATRKELEALRAEVFELRAELDALAVRKRAGVR